MKHPERPATTRTDLPGKVNRVMISADGRWVVTSCVVAAETSSKSSSFLEIWDRQTGQIGSHQLNAGLFSFDASNRWLTALDFRGNMTVYAWDLQAGGHILAPLVHSGHHQNIYDLRLAADGRFFVTASGDRTVRLWDLDSADFRRQQPATCFAVLNLPTAVRDAAISPDGSRILTAHNGTCLWLFDLRLDRLIASVQRRCGRSLTAGERREFKLDSIGLAP